MTYLFLQIWGWLIAAFALGWVSHWFFCCRGKQHDESEDTRLESQISPSNDADSANGSESAAVNNTEAIDEQWKPQGFNSAPDQVDDLKRIKGVGSVIEETLNDLGIYQFSQISGWDADNIAWIEDFLSFPGRIERENWVQQAKTLASGGDTDFSKRVDGGQVDYE